MRLIEETERYLFGGQGDSAEKKTFAAGHPISMKLEITNVGNEVRQYSEHRRMVNNDLVVTDCA